MNDLRSYDLYTSLAQNDDSITSASHTAADALAVAISTAIVYPLDSIIARLQVRYAQREGEDNHTPAESKESKRKDDAADDLRRSLDVLRDKIQHCLDTVRDVVKMAREGWKDPNGRRALYAGVGEAASKEAFEFILVGALYSLLSRRLSRGGGGMSWKAQMVNDVSAGVLSRALVRLLTEPIATIVVRRQVSSQGRKEAVETVISEKGIGGFWSGYWATLILTARPSIMALAYWALRTTLARVGKVGGNDVLKEGAVTMAITRTIAESVLYTVSVMQTCARAGVTAPVNSRGRGSLMLEISRGLLSQGTTALTQDVLAALMLRLSAILLYILEPFMLSEDAITESVRDSAGTADQQLVDDAEYLTKAVKGAAGMRNRSTGLTRGSKDGYEATDAVAELVGDYVEEAPDEQYRWFWDKEGRR
ncbi:uncharacterized protein GIQ15_02068 [Arthroderma uncinatum]|uniref:uncharacterized protein n=1 Tax=Arthroderma uncinatum TaxID=74035 RepID=UPI00144A69BC|nr:uncharacterized protein GIQ15_02068 [Arthroderma uncinatum]KAF3482744.1 hypothetical protein GIQ15_02068 [Arthroderma uncinatum]